MKLWELDNMIATICPIYGINFDGIITFKSEATDEQRAAAQIIMDENISKVEE